MPGIDPEGLVRAVVANLRSGGRREQGASTITQQVAKNFLVGNERSYERKIREALIALRMESTFSKDKILELYLNEIFLGTLTPGRNLHGIAAAALDYFGKSVHELTIAEAAYIAALPKGPNNYHPFRQRKAAIERRNWVIERMADNGYISSEDAAAAKKEPLNVKPRLVSPNSIASGYFAEGVRRDIAERYGEESLYEGGLLIRSTLDPKMQAMARKALVDGLVRFDEARGWRGAQQKIDLAGREWGLALAEVPALGDVQPWRLAVVLEVAARTGQDRLCSRGGKPPVRWSRTARPASVTADGVKWTRRPVERAVAVGDVVYRRAAGRQAGPVPPAPDSGDLGRHRRHGPVYGPRPRHGRRVLLRPERVQPGDPGHAPAGLLVQADRLCDGARQRLYALEHDHGCPLRARYGPGPGRLGAVELRRQVRPACAPCATASSIPRT